LKTPVSVHRRLARLVRLHGRLQEVVETLAHALFRHEVVLFIRPGPAELPEDVAEEYVLLHDLLDGHLAVPAVDAVLARFPVDRAEREELLQVQLVLDAAAQAQVEALDDLLGALVPEVAAVLLVQAFSKRLDHLLDGAFLRE
jgi:NADPH-dependent ferric siderophore reductase